MSEGVELGEEILSYLPLVRSLQPPFSRHIYPLLSLSLSLSVILSGEQLQLKEALLGQLRRSQQQYGVMKLFYEQKLHALYEEMNEKQEERDRLMSELQGNTPSHY